ncbi:hypothetical protein [Streptomyces regalis]|uniref:Uncharacterized protein n=1 Tax=Streptomyces regalis TaxID=68262 RepID=A0A0X3VGL1_9ACTN|nr:hypothetical protein [Streptomyces regalis]KUL43392.1 hypothetical protein ADL12_08055 [Streptomyces regalis]
MTWPAALPGAALRVVRTAAGRRALQVVLVVGGLFALGFLCGERAYAADGVSVGTASTSSVPSASSESSVSSASSASSASSTDLRSATENAVEGFVTAPAKPGVRDEAIVPAEPATPRHPAPQDQAPRAGAPHPTDDQILSPVARHVSQAVGTHVVQPVGDVVRTVTEGLPVLPTAPESPAWPGLPGLEFPGLPDVPGTELPGLPPVPGQTLPAPVTGTPQPGSAAPAPGDRRDDEGRTGREEATVVHGPRFVADAAASHAPVVGGVHLGATFGYAPVRQIPVDHPAGVLGNRSAGDGGTSRHGDAHAVSLNQRPPLRLVPGAAARVDADEIQDRHRDIPVSPA